MPKTQPFCVIGAVQYEMEKIESRPQEIADWAYVYYSHTVEDPTEEMKIARKLTKKDCFEDGDKIYIISKPSLEK